MRILLVSSKTFPSKGGVEFIVDTLARNLSKNGHKVSVMTNFYRTSSAGLSEWRGFLSWFRGNFTRRVRAILGGGDFDLGYRVVETYFIFFGISNLRSILSIFLFLPTFLHYLYLLVRINPEVINLHFVDNATVYILLTKILFPSKKVIVSIHGDDVLKFGRNPIHRFLVQSLLGRADSIVGVSKDFVNKAREVLGYDGKVDVIYNSIDGNFLSNPVQTKNKELPEKYILSVGRLVHKKGFDILIEAFREFQKRSKKEIHLVIIGGGELIEQLRKEALGLWIDFTDSRSRDYVMEAMDHCEFFVCPSREEPFGIVNLEAMARGKPLLAASVGGIPEYIEHEKNGLLYKDASVKNLYDEMIKLYNDPALRERLATAGKRTVQKKFTEKVMVKKYLDLYKS